VPRIPNDEQEPFLDPIGVHGVHFPNSQTSSESTLRGTILPRSAVEVNSRGRRHVRGSDGRLR
jgi:hypothetical protein